MLSDVIVIADGHDSDSEDEEGDAGEHERENVKDEVKPHLHIPVQHHPRQTTLQYKVKVIVVTLYLLSSPLKMDIIAMCIHYVTIVIAQLIID